MTPDELRQQIAAAKTSTIEWDGLIYWLRSNAEALCDLWEAAEELHAEVEMAESVGTCLPSRGPSLKVGEILARLRES